MYLTETPHRRPARCLHKITRVHSIVKRKIFQRAEGSDAYQFRTDEGWDRVNLSHSRRRQGKRLAIAVTLSVLQYTRVWCDTDEREWKLVDRQSQSRRFAPRVSGNSLKQLKLTKPDHPSALLGS